MKKTQITTLFMAGAAVFSMAAGSSVLAAPETGSYTIQYNYNAENTEDMPEYQFLSGNMKGMLNNESRLSVDVTLELEEDEKYRLESSCYVTESGKIAEVGDDTGIGMTLITTAEGSYTENEDGTITIAVPEHAEHVLKTDTYSSQMKSSAGIQVAGSSDDGEWDSDEEPSILEFIPETIFTLSDDGKIVDYDYADPEDAKMNEKETETADTESEEGNALLVITSDDTATTFTLNDNGTYTFEYADYGITDIGTYVYDASASSLTITDANGKETVSSVDGENVVFHYEYSESDQLTGDYTVAVTELEKIWK